MAEQQIESDEWMVLHINTYKSRDSTVAAEPRGDQLFKYPRRVVSVQFVWVGEEMKDPVTEGSWVNFTNMPKILKSTLV